MTLIEENKLWVGTKWEDRDLLMTEQSSVDVMASARANSGVVYSDSDLGLTSKMFQFMWQKDY